MNLSEFNELITHAGIRNDMLAAGEIPICFG
jgi:hypothetical protein